MELIQQVERAFNEYPPHKIAYGFITLQSCLEEILKSDGNNTYRIPHMNKDRLRQEGRLPNSLPVGNEALLKIDQLENE